MSIKVYGMCQWEKFCEADNPYDDQAVSYL